MRIRPVLVSAVENGRRFRVVSRSMSRLSKLQLSTALASIGFLFATSHCDVRKLGSPAPPAESASPVGSVAVPPPMPLPTPLPPLSPGAVLEDERNTIGVFRAVAKSTVFVTEKQVVVDFFRGQAVEVPAGSGPG